MGLCLCVSEHAASRVEAAVGRADAHHAQRALPAPRRHCRLLFRGNELPVEAQQGPLHRLLHPARRGGHAGAPGPAGRPCRGWRQRQHAGCVQHERHSQPPQHASCGTVYLLCAYCVHTVSPSPRPVHALLRLRRASAARLSCSVLPSRVPMPRELPGSCASGALSAEWCLGDQPHGYGLSQDCSRGLHARCASCCVCVCLRVVCVLTRLLSWVGRAFPWIPPSLACSSIRNNAVRAAVARCACLGHQLPRLSVRHGLLVAQGISRHT